MSLPTLELETALEMGLPAGALVAGMDEVGRGAWAGPVGVGVAVINAGVGAPPAGLNDSKQLTEARRESLVEPLRAWVVDSAIGWASPAEVDAHGIMVALRLAGWRALREVGERGHFPAALILDGNVDYISPPGDLLAELWGQGTGPAELVLTGVEAALPVTTLVKGDTRSAAVAAAAVLAKVERDHLMARLDDPGYEWAKNKGYGSAAHRAALEAMGFSEYHRKSWRLPAQDQTEA